MRTSTGQLALLSTSHLQPIFGWGQRAGFNDEGDGGEGTNGASGINEDESVVVGNEIDESKLFGQVYVPPDQRKGRHAGDEFADMMTARVTPTPLIVFLGVLESPSNSVDQPQPQPAVQVGEGIRGVPYFALDVAGTGKEQDVLSLKLVEGHDDGGGGGGDVGWGSARFASVGFTKQDAAIFGEARSVLDWNARNKVCVWFLFIYLLLTSPLYHPLLNISDGDDNG